VVSKRLLLLPSALLLAGLSGCASIPADWGRSEAAQFAASHGRSFPQTDDAAVFTREALSRPLTPETAVQLALLNNPALRRQG
jgi:cobalt-zinc-cadmium efflux system outer membrane protein